MKLNFSILPFAIVTTAFVLPNIEVMEQIAVEKRLPSHLNRVKDPTGAVLSGLNTQTAITVQKPLRFAISSVTKETKAKIKCHQSAALFDVQADFASSVKVDENIDIEKSINLLPSPHKKQMGDETLPTVYQLLSTSKKTQKFAKLINDFPDLVELLNGTAANYTVFAPIDEGVHDAPEDDKPSKELLHKVLTYHISPIPYNAYSVFFARTIRTLQKEEELGDYPQRLRVGFGLGGLQLNFQSKLLSTDNASELISSSPSQFSTFELALLKTGLEKVLPDHHIGGTVFAPSNAAFMKLGPMVNAFLFSKAGEGLLNALVQYHIVANHKMYSDAYFMHDGGDGMERDAAPGPGFHVDLPTLLRGQSLSIDVKRWGRIMDVRVNGFLSVQVVDGVARDGVVHTMGDVLLPPKNPRREPRDGGDELKEFKARFEGLVEDV